MNQGRARNAGNEGPLVDEVSWHRKVAGSEGVILTEESARAHFR